MKIISVRADRIRAVDEGPILERAWPPDISTSLTSEDPTTNCQPSTPCLKLAPGFSNSPVRGLDFAAPSYTHPSLYNDKTVIVQAPGFLNNPARELDFAPFDYTHQSLYNSDTVNVQAPGFSNSPARGPNFAPSGYTHQSLYNSDAVNVQAPGFLNSPARGLDFAPPTYTQSSLYNKNTVIMQAPGFSESSARGLEFAPSNSTRPSLYNTITLEAPSFWSRPFIAGPNPTSTNKPDGVLSYTSICGAHPQGTISCPQADSQGTVQPMGITQLSRIL